MSDTVTWRLQGPPLAVRVVALAAAGWISVTGLGRLLSSGRPLGGGDLVLVVGYLFLLVGLVAAALVTARTRVRISDAGVEVRETGTRLYRWEEIRGVRADVPGRPRLVLLELEAGQRRVLPVPSASLRRSGDSTVPDAVELLQRRHEQHRLGS
jgi:hypothetical protein